MSHRSYTLDELKKAVKESASVAEVLTRLGLAPKGGNYSTFKRLQQKHNIDTSHFYSGAAFKEKIQSKCGHKQPIPLENVLTTNSNYNSDALKKRLIKEGIKIYKCESCGLSEWLGKPIPLELEHSDGDHSNNLLSNLKILCPNCHAHTPTYRERKNKGKKYGQRNFRIKSKLYCTLCGCELKAKPKTGLCFKCYNQNRIQAAKEKRPPIEQLLKEINESSYSAVGRKYGVSDNAIRKWVAADIDFYALVS